jgi:dihydroorotase
MKLLFKNAHIIDAQSPYHLQTVDVLVDGDTIESIGEIAAPEGATVIDLNGDTLTTGFAELHSDLGELGNEESETLQTGAAAAAAGGFTAVGVVSNGGPYLDEKTGIEFLLSKGESVPVNIVPIGTMSKGRKGEELSEMFEMNNYGTNVFGDYKQGVANANLLKLALLYTKPFGTIMVHPEDRNLSVNGMMHEGATSTYVGLKGIPEISETIQIARDLSLLEYTEGNLHIASVSTVDGVEAIREAKRKGLNVTCSVNLHHLIFTDEDLTNYDTSLKVSPPIRTDVERAVLWEAVLDGTVDCLAVDHLPKDIEQKQCEFDNAAFGMAGFEGALSAFLDRYEITPERLQEIFSIQPRKLLGLPELRIAEGEVAEFTILGNAEQQVTAFASKAFNNPFKGMDVKSSVRGVYVKENYLSLEA